MKKIWFIFILIIIMFSSLNFPMNVNATSSYQLAIIEDSKMIILGNYNIDDITSYYDLYKDDYYNLLLLKDDKIVEMELGIVIFVKDDNCAINIEYVDSNQNNGYTNPCYGIDAAYLSTTDDLTKVDVYLSNTDAIIDINKLNLIPIEEIKDISYYYVLDGVLNHSIKTDEDNYYNVDYELGPIDILEDGNYFSYDGHYFYTEIDLMFSDYQNSIFDNAINENPYYNYYQYLSHRSTTSYTKFELEDYYNNFLNIDSRMESFIPNFNSSISDTLNESQFYNEIESFIFVQNEFGSNALEMLAIASNESAIGRSSLAFRKNNLFGHAAYDSSVEQSSKRYLTVTNSILSHGKNYISKLYANPQRFQYHGAYFGDKASGMNVSYASDPYWGEKATSYFYHIDKNLGFKDKDQYAIGICNNCSLQDKEGNTILELNLKDYAIILLEDTGDRYKVQYDKATSSNYSYDFVNDVAYVMKEDIKTIINQESINNVISYDKVTLNAGEGFFSNDVKSYTYLKRTNTEIVTIKPSLDNYDFIGFVDGVATFKEIASINLSDDFKKVYQVNDYVDLNDSYLLITYKDNTTNKVKLTTDYLSNYQIFNLQTNSLNIVYSGVKIQFQVEANETPEFNLDNYLQYFDNPLKLFNSFNQGDLSDISITDLRSVDSKLLVSDRNSYQIPSMINVSGLSLNYFDSKQYLYKQNLYNLNNNEFNNSKMIDTIVDNGYIVYDSFDFSMQKNNKPVELVNPISISVPLDIGIGENNSFYLFIFKNNDIIRCKVEESNDKLSFKLNKLGNVVIAYKKSNGNEYVSDQSETVINNVLKESFVEEYQFYLIATISLLFIIIIIIIIRGRK